MRERQTDNILTKPNAGEDVEHQELLFIAGGMQIKWDSHF
jgi:hypothetical protein